MAGADRRARRLSEELREIVVRRLEQQASGVCQGPGFDALLADVVDRRLDPYSAAEQIVEGADRRRDE